MGVRLTQQRHDNIVENLLRRNNQGIIGIDGELGSGKTTFARAVAERLGARVVHLDSYLEPGKQKYLDALKFGEIHAAIRNAGRPVIVEGVCLLSVFQRLGLALDLHIFLTRGNRRLPYRRDSRIVSEVEEYFRRTSAASRADVRLTMHTGETNQLDVDIVYLKSKMLVSALLVLGGICALVVGAFILSLGIEGENSAVFEILGAKVTTKGIGAVVIGSSVFWAYFAYLARPKYSRRRESRTENAPDGTAQSYELETATMQTAGRDDRLSE